MKNAEEFFDGNAPDNDNVIITGKRYSRQQCIELMEQYASLREKETAIGFLMYHLGKSEALAQYQRDIYERKFDKYTKHKEG